MNDREAREAGSASAEARRTVPGLAPKPSEDFRQDMMLRYLHAMASHSAQAAGAEPAVTGHDTIGKTSHATPHAKGVAALQVRYILKRTIAGVSPETPYLDVARTLAREQIGAVPVVDTSGRVIGVVAESDLLARAASLSSDGERTSTFRRLLGRRQHPGEADVTAAALMSTPPLTVHPWTSIAEAARTAARSRIRQMFVTDHKGRLVGVVSRSELLQALVRDDKAIREEVISHILRDELGIDPVEVDVHVHNGTVALRGSLPADQAGRLTDAVARIPDVFEVADHLTVR
ncbi:CBS domain-containing protein [Streptomyces sp. NPDC047461]|uniref:CBS domain-containing protein n=1 Tax=Streptomyces sp. NPDC047461 TaxID=3155619 RepID=UPI0033E5B540